MNLSSIAQNIELLSKEKKIDPSVIISAIEDAVVTASRKQFRTGEDLHARYNLDGGTIELYAIKTVVEVVEDPARELTVPEANDEVGEGAEVGDMLELPRPMEDLGRIAAQTAKQIILQKVREAERNNVYEEYIGRLGELVNGFIKRFESGKMIFDLGNGVEAVMPKSQQSRVENFTQGERLRCVISNVNKESRGPQIEVSRTSPEMVKRLFEMEVPEIYDGTVVIKAAVREPGDRAKIAVMSNERDVDPVGACVGMKGSRVQSIIRELRGEKIDIIEWSEDPAIFAANALSPAKVSKVTVLDFEQKKLQVTVENEQQSLAIGKRGQNVRLAARLVGWDIDIRSEEEMKREIATQMEQMLSSPVVPLTFIEGITPSDSETLAEHGIETIEQLADASVDDICDWLDLSVDEAEDLIVTAQEIAEARRERLAVPGDDDYVEEFEGEEAGVEAYEEADEEPGVEMGEETGVANAEDATKTAAEEVAEEVVEPIAVADTADTTAVAAPATAAAQAPEEE
ncbi:MAG: transcription termination/antitermination protein NusA [Acidobacteria bacterium]|nr:transcription termination/antitermination protein NusA [Acidobacteriota bacterium]MBI3422340.1 transcription termination/antitermination protein NusA [Acidobacteriota bacterium]